MKTFSSIIPKDAGPGWNGFVFVCLMVLDHKNIWSRNAEHDNSEVSETLLSLKALRGQLCKNEKRNYFPRRMKNRVLFKFCFFYRYLFCCLITKWKLSLKIIHYLISHEMRLHTSALSLKHYEWSLSTSLWQEAKYLKSLQKPLAVANHFAQKTLPQT